MLLSLTIIVGSTVNVQPRQIALTGILRLSPPNRGLSGLGDTKLRGILPAVVPGVKQREVNRCPVGAIPQRRTVMPVKKIPVKGTAKVHVKRTVKTRVVKTKR